MVTSILIGACFALVLRAFFAAVKVDWPAAYYSGDRRLDPIVSRDPVRFSAFRFIPVYLSAVMVAAGAFQLDASPRHSLLAFGAIFVALSSAPAVWRDLHYRKSITGALLLDLFILIGTIGSMVVAFLTYHRVSFIAPDLRGLATNVWATVLALSLAALAISLVKKRFPDNELIERSLSELGPTVEGRIREAAYPDTDALLAIAIAENLQRPPWVRRLEFRLLRGPLRGTFGVFQVASTKPLKDEAALEVFLTKRSLESLPQPSTGLSMEWLQELFLHINDDKDFARLATIAYYQIRTSSPTASQTEDQAIHPDVRAMPSESWHHIQVTTVKRHSGSWEITGRARDLDSFLSITPMLGRNVQHPIQVFNLQQTDLWQDWHILIPGDQWNWIAISSTHDEETLQACLSRRYD